MRSRRQLPTAPPHLRRSVAALAAVLVMLLTFSASSPELHAWLHPDGTAEKSHPCRHHADVGGTAQAPTTGADGDEAHECAVTMFSHGVMYHLVAGVAQPCEGILREVNFRAFERLALAQPRFLQPPPQAPPAA